MNLQETVLIQLRDLILRGEFEPGQRLAEQQLAERLGASRTPVRAALVTLEQEGLVEANETGKFLVRQFTPREVADAIAVRGHLEGMAARLVAEHGVSRQLQLDLQACLDDGDSALAANPLDYESYAAYAVVNDRFHALVLEASGNRALQRAVALNDKLPFAPASAMLPMQGTVALDRDWMLYAHRQHHMLFAALKAGEGARAQALAIEHTEVAQMNMRMALERRSETERVLPAIRLVVGR
ncbi:MAG: GntR family transcriptional regulator [Pseudomonadota bacterium]|jgi:GntR family transcriptional regulator of vanillate catabolism|uniref:GntR family transcriptional regulator n=1 Tax=unclassified Polaromonas TaxID=2638319 RepID=UPI000BDD2900|nr:MULTISPECIES: GntR family transcriptional regulator [unclassified Polaromonas]MDO9258972.1 GntR family transcriptional regulator [Polaromonas sp.]OYY35029.1 MAG: GntR family transcriptional regulator [Polaromonas sp. 35-63-35]OYZ20169.1 MAG: GntR family transcriptional regulator [Polaromonas sp. 16-63-31]OYZ77924.1 MAG: GntR family transcriptional regulator [Polaromonas sp. 24-63-21]OZA49434.1 MAG: GntR family transcriptional regulator [Polaromonas sp. 17-63-33]